jgi:hypothetical protein
MGIRDILRKVGAKHKKLLSRNIGRLEKGITSSKRTKFKIPKSKGKKVIIKYVGGRPQRYEQPATQRERAINILDVEDKYFGR